MAEDFSELKELLHSSSLRSATREASLRWLDKSKWRPVSIEEYFTFLESIQEVKKSFHSPKAPHPVMREGKYRI